MKKHNWDILTIHWSNGLRFYRCKHKGCEERLILGTVKVKHENKIV